MKNKAILILVICFIYSSSFSQKDPVVMTINDRAITKSDFLQVYLKNNPDPKYDQASLDEYMELFKNFKLKVAEARALGYDTIPALKKELDGYKKQLSKPYLTDKEKNNELIEEAYERMKYEVDASHILIMVKEDAPSSDTLAAYEKIMKLKKRINSGEDFANVALSRGGSEDPSVGDNKGRLGYFTAFQMVYPFESIAYQTPVGQVGGPIRTQYGYHLVKVHDKRPARGTMTAAHIMIAVGKDADQTDVNNAQKKIDEIYQKLIDGEDFSKMVRLYSDDQSSKQKGGQLPPFGTGTTQRMISEFEDAAFEIEKDLGISKPFRTDYGFHIIQRIAYEPLRSFEELRPELQEKVNRGDRGQQTQKSFISKLKKSNKFKDNSAKGLKWFNENVDSTIFRSKWVAPDMKKSRVLFTYANEKYTMADFKAHLEKSQRILSPKPIDQHVYEKYKEWQEQVIIKDEESKLADRHPELRALLNEYEDGVLLYEIMKDKVWDKAITDTVGLLNFFEARQDNYQWSDRIEAEVFSSSKEEIAKNIFDQLKASDTLKSRDLLEQINKDSQLNVSLKSGIYSTSDSPFIGKEPVMGVNPIHFSEDKFHVVRVKELLPARPKTLKEAKGLVIQDYQAHLEAEWIKNLRKTHTLEINNDVLYSLGK